MLAKRRSYRDARIAFVHGRPGPHPTHATLANSVNADFVFVDSILRYHDLENTGIVRRYTSWLLNSVFFQNASQYDLILAEGMHVPPVIMKKLRILRPNQKIAGIMGDECLFFMKTGWYSPKTQKLLSYTLGHYDALICMCNFQAELANEIFDGKKRIPEILVAHEIISPERPREIENTGLRRNGHNLLFVAHGPSGWRGYYKGIETLLRTFKLVARKYHDARLTVIGDWDKEYVDNLLRETENIRSNIAFVGRQKDLPSFFKDSDLCVHLTNGDAFPIATLEAVRAGLPTLVSNLTGTKEVIEKVNPRMVVSMDPEAANDAIGWYFELSPDEKKAISDKGLEVMKEYTAEKGIEEFREAVNSILEK